MTGVAKLTGATTNLGNWKVINWHKVGAEVKRLQTCPRENGDAYCKGSEGREKE